MQLTEFCLPIKKYHQEKSIIIIQERLMWSATSKAPAYGIDSYTIAITAIYHGCGQSSCMYNYVI